MALDQGARQHRRRRPPPRACRHLPEPCFQREAIAAQDLIHLGNVCDNGKDHALMECRKSKSTASMIAGSLVGDVSVGRRIDNR